MATLTKHLQGTANDHDQQTLGVAATLSQTSRTTEGSTALPTASPALPHTTSQESTLTMCTNPTESSTTAPVM
jgi:hypothetical protein